MSGRRSIYRRVNVPGHPRANKGLVLEHIIVVERALGHPLPPKAVIHHVNEDSQDNANSNLVVLQNQREHRQLHARLRVFRAGGNPWTERFCGKCGTLRPLDDFYAGHPTKRRTECKTCSKQRLRDYTAAKRRTAKAEAA